MKYSAFKYPQRIFCDTELSKTAKVIAGVLYAYRNAFGVCRKSQKELAALAGIASENTVCSALRELAAAGYITVATSSYYSKERRAVIRGKNSYHCDLDILKDGYTVLPREIFSRSMTICERLTYISIHVAAGNQNRAFPSIQRLQKMTGCARSTICKALQILKSLPALLVRRCVKRNGAFAANSYIMSTILVRIPAADVRSADEQTRYLRPPAQDGRTPSIRRVVSACRQIFAAASMAAHSFFERGVVRFLRC